MEIGIGEVYKMKQTIRRVKGFTLIELMIVIAIVGILAAVAYPSYTDSLRGARRVDAMNNLLKYQIEQEKHRASNVEYAGDFIDLIGAGAAGIASSEGYYNLTVDSSSATAFVLIATATGDQANDSCGNFSVNQNGPNYDAGYAGATCWNQ